jgi:hypothetical protein
VLAVAAWRCVCHSKAVATANRSCALTQSLIATWHSNDIAILWEIDIWKSIAPPPPISSLWLLVRYGHEYFSRHHSYNFAKIISLVKKQTNNVVQ